MSQTTQVKNLLQRALRRLSIETDYRQAPDNAYQVAFDVYVDMFNEWKDRGYILYNQVPANMNNTVGTMDNFSALVNCLTVRLAPEFSIDVSPLMTRQAERSFHTIRTRQCGRVKMKKPKSMPRGSGNTWYRGYQLIVPDNDCSQTECIETEDADNIIL